MIRRCTDPRDRHYKNYGGRGIQVCDRWLKFENFLADMGERPAGLTLERQDNDGSYEPGNCRWATHMQQGSNTRKNKLLTFRGETFHLSEWARRLGMKRARLGNRLLRGWSVERALGESK